MERREALITLGLGALAVGSGVRSGAGAEPAVSQAASIEGFENGQFVLPPLPYDYAALEPHIDAETMKLHHDKHHAGYVKGANAAMAALADIRDGKRPESETKAWERDLAFHVSGHVLHTLFWRNLSPKPGAPSTAFAKLIESDFGDIEKLKARLGAAAKSVEGSGWGILGWHPMTKGLLVLQAEKHQNLTAQGVAPLLVLDVWEHAYYLKYQNKRDDYVDALWNIVDWADVSKRYEAAGGK